MKKVIVVFLLITSIVAFGQKPIISGYLGKINYVMLKYNTGVRLRHPEKWKPSNEVSSSYFEGFSFKSELEVNVGHTFSNRFVFEAIGGFNSLTMDLNHHRSAFYYVNDLGFRLDYDYYQGYPKITDIYAGASTRFYVRKKGSLAPIGVYYGLKLNYHTYAINFNNILAGSWGSFNQNATSAELNYGKYYFRFIEYSGTVGISRAITDRVLLDFGFSVGWGIPGPNFYGPNIPNSGSIESDVLDMIQLYQVGKLHIAAGYLF